MRIGVGMRSHLSRVKGPLHNNEAKVTGDGGGRLGTTLGRGKEG